MPCYQIQTMKVELKKANKDLLEKALKKLGYIVTRNGESFSFVKGKVSGKYQGENLVITAQTVKDKPDTDEIKRAYSEQVVLRIAAKHAHEGWEMTKENGEYVMQRPATTSTVQA